MSKSLTLLSLAAGLCLMICPRGISAQIADPVRIESGLLSSLSGSDPSVRVFKGIPFAAPPVGDLRWRPPQPVKSWKGVRKADHFGPSAMQANTGPFGPWTKEFIFGNEVSEDCLYLNVWTAAKAAGAKRPVLVYIHGGAFTGGSGEVAVYNGEALAKKGLVVVTINYRLGVLGFLAHPELTKESRHNASGNYGLLDQVAALQWVQKNIAAFGGDPNNVTIAGQSAGAASVHFLTASPLAKGLFQRAIAESGSGVGGFTRPREAAEQDGLKFAQEKGVDSLAKLRALPAKDLIASSPGSTPFRFGPVIDGWFLPEDVTAVFAKSQQNDVPTLTGLTADEGSFSPNYGKIKADAFQKQAQQRYGDRAETFLKLYPADSDAEAGAAQKASGRDQGVISMALWAENRAKTARMKAYLYYFARAIPWPQHPEFGAFHTSEVPYVFHNLDRLERLWESADRKLTDIVSSYWVNFATKGDPNGSGLPRWPAFDANNVRLLRLDAQPTPLPLPERAKQNFFTEILTGNRAQTSAAIEYYRLVPGFLPEKKNAMGFATGTGFAQTNPWGTYTAYLMATNARGQRTWRIENYMQMGNFTQGSTMYLFEGAQRALLVDTAQDTPEEMGKNDLKTVVRYLLAHNNDGSARTNPVDFVVCNTHFHGDHTGKNSQMSDRTVYYPDLDWPNTNAPANYVPIREGGGVTSHGSGQAVGEIALGDRTITAINLYGHTPGSMSYLDRENNLIATGDAIGSGLVWMHFGPLSQYANYLRRLKAVLALMDNPAILPAHFYQIAMGKRAQAPINGRPLDKQYVDDQLAAAEGVLDGSLVGEPYRVVGRNVVVVTVRSAGMTYALNRLHPDGVHDTRYRALRIPGEMDSSAAPSPVDNIKSEFYLIRDGANNSLYLIKGSSRALLVGTGAGAPGLADFVGKLIGKVPLAVIVTSDDSGQIGGLLQFADEKVFFPKGSTISRKGLHNVSEIGEGNTIWLGSDSAGRPLAIQVEPLTGHSRAGLTLLDVSDRVLLSGDALGAQAADGGLILHGKLADFSSALANWRARTDGKYDVVYTAHNFEWLTLPAFVDQVQNAMMRGLSEGDGAFTNSAAMPGHKMVKSTGAANVVASIVFADVEAASAP